MAHGARHDTKRRLAMNDDWEIDDESDDLTGTIDTGEFGDV